eukprot:TRINITY_DN1777_c0_g1_i7.p1 TRINITY_DN1777_c0_g1~~TRINITY_DN1777_c0_g1_i7.p1  ORF type:complete len:139 (-),score=18.11 TRINITY_DN1777_c0_g1_i7:295-711(-)
MPDDVVLQLVTVVLTNLAFLPVVWMGWKRKDYTQFVVFLMTFVTSLAYHFAETVKWKRFFGMTPGNWHRLDTVCSILVFQFLALRFTGIRDPSTREGVRWMLLMVCLWCQEKSPWEVIWFLGHGPELDFQRDIPQNHN